MPEVHLEKRLGFSETMLDLIVSGSILCTKCVELGEEIRLVDETP